MGRLTRVPGHSHSLAHVLSLRPISPPARVLASPPPPLPPPGVRQASVSTHLARFVGGAWHVYEKLYRWLPLSSSEDGCMWHTLLFSCSTGSHRHFPARQLAMPFYSIFLCRLRFCTFFGWGIIYYCCWRMATPSLFPSFSPGKCIILTFRSATSLTPPLFPLAFGLWSLNSLQDMSL